MFGRTLVHTSVLAGLRDNIKFKDETIQSLKEALSAERSLAHNNEVTLNNGINVLKIKISNAEVAHKELKHKFDTLAASEAKLHGIKEALQAKAELRGEYLQQAKDKYEALEAAYKKLELEKSDLSSAHASLTEQFDHRCSMLQAAEHDRAVGVERIDILRGKLADAMDLVGKLTAQVNELSSGQQALSSVANTTGPNSYLAQLVSNIQLSILKEIDNVKASQTQLIAAVSTPIGLPSAPYPPEPIKWREPADAMEAKFAAQLEQGNAGHFSTVAPDITLSNLQANGNADSDATLQVFDQQGTRIAESKEVFTPDLSLDLHNEGEVFMPIRLPSQFTQG